MRNLFSKLALTAALALAITLTIGCPNTGGDDGGGATCGGKAYDTGKYGCVNNEIVGTCGGSYYNPENERCLNGEIQNGAEIVFPSSSSGNGQGGSFNVNSQIYVDASYCDDNDLCHHSVGEAYKGSGIIKIPIYDNYDILMYLDAGNVTSGLVNLNLPNIPDKYLEDPLERIDRNSCSNYTEGIKDFYVTDFVLTNSNGDELGTLNIKYQDEQIVEAIYYWYYSKSGKMTCILDDPREIINEDFKAGWNKIYRRSITDGNGKKTKEYSTNNILTKEVKWTIYN